MYKVNIETSQNVNVYLPTASLVERIFAYVIDWVILILYFYLVQSVFSGLVESFLDEIGQNRYNSITYLLFTPILFYSVLLEYFNNGQTVGKKLMKIKVMQIDGSRPSLGSYFTRWITGLFEIQLFLGTPAMVCIMFNEHGQRIGDIAAGTSVVKLKQPTLLKSPTDKLFTKDYELVFPKVSLFNDEQMALIHRVLNQQELILRNQCSLELSKKIKSEYSIHDKGLKPHQFLRQLIKDYAYLNYLEENKGQFERLKNLDTKESVFGSAV